MLFLVNCILNNFTLQFSKIYKFHKILSVVFGGDSIIWLVQRTALALNVDPLVRVQIPVTTLFSFIGLSVILPIMYGAIKAQTYRILT